MPRGVNDQSYFDTALTGTADFSILKGIPIPAGGSVLVYVSTYLGISVGTPAKTTGTVNINTRVDTL